MTFGLPPCPCVVSPKPPGRVAMAYRWAVLVFAAFNVGLHLFGEYSHWMLVHAVAAALFAYLCHEGHRCRAAHRKHAALCPHYPHDQHTL